MIRSGLIITVIATLGFAFEQQTLPLRENGSVAAWTVIGPFPNAKVTFHDESCFGFFTDYLTAIGGEAQVAPQEGDIVTYNHDQTLKWRTAFSNLDGQLNFVDIFSVDRSTPGVAYAFSEIIVDTPRDVALKIRSNDGVRTWLNGKLIHDHHIGRTLDAGEDKVFAHLEAGKNRLLCKVDQGGGDWGLAVKIVNLNGRTLQGVQTTITTTKSFTGKILNATLEPTSLILNSSDGDFQVVQLDLFSGGLEDVACKITKPEWPEALVIRLGDLVIGRHHLQLKIPEVTKTESVQVRIECPTDQYEITELIFAKPRHWVIYLVQQVHTDIGYTKPQSEILPEHLRYIDYALDYCDLTDDYPDDAKFRFTCETSWPVREYVQRRPTTQIDRLRKRVQEGRIEITGMFLNMSEIADEGLLAASLQPIRLFKEHGFPIHTAMQNDVNGIAWCLVDYFSDIGVKYVTMGINKTRSQLPFDKPTAFWWESPSGKRVLAYRPDHYHTGNFWKLHEGNTELTQAKILEYLQNLEKKEYPFDRIAVQFSGMHTDNSPPSMKACDLVRVWNEKYAWPRLRLATAEEFLQYVSENHTTKLPVFRAAWPDWWTDGFGSAARETASARKTQIDMQVNTTLLAIAQLYGKKLPATTLNRVAAIQDNLLFYDEHTFGASKSISDPMAETSRVQWSEKSSYIWDAAIQSSLLREEALGLLQDVVPRSQTPIIAIFNTLGWRRSGVAQVFIDHGIVPADRPFRVLDTKTGEPIPTQFIDRRTEGSHWALWISNIPALGFRTYKLELLNKSKSVGPITPTEKSLENRYYKIQVNPLTGAITSITDLDTNHNLVDPSSQWQLGQLIHEKSLSGRDLHAGQFERSVLKNVKIHDTVDGELWKKLTITGEIESCSAPESVSCEIRLYENQKRIGFHYSIRFEPCNEPEALYVAFPFEMSNGKIIYEAQGGMVSPGVDQLPGSSADWHTVQNYVSLKGDNGQIILSSDEIPLVQFGDINTGKWQYLSKFQKPYVFSWIANNYWFTNFQPFQEGEFHWSYDLTSDSDQGNLDAVHLAYGFRVPLVSRVLPPGKANDSNKIMSPIFPNVSDLLMVNARPVSEKDGIILHLREVEGKNINLEFEPWAGRFHSVDEVNVLEELLQADISELSFKPFEVKFVRLTF